MHFYKKQYFVTFYVTLSSLSTWKVLRKVQIVKKLSRILTWKTKLKLMYTLTKQD